MNFRQMQIIGASFYIGYGIKYYNLKMLSSIPKNHCKNYKQNEYILRRQARNLRAKVKALLPIEVCHKYSNRNKNILEMKNNKTIWDSLYTTKSWRYCPITNLPQLDEFYYEKPKKINRSQRFQKLTLEEIEQIKEDKLYYLGQENLEDFQKYLNDKNKKTKHRSNTSEDCKNRVKKWECLKQSREIQQTSKQFEQYYQSQSDILQLIDENRPMKKTISITTNSHKKNIRSTLQKEIEFAERRKIVEFEQKSRITTHKVKMNMRLQKAENNLRELKIKNMSRLENKREREDEKLRLIQTKRENLWKKSEIKKIEEELRRTCLSRMKRKHSEQKYYQFTH